MRAPSRFRSSSVLPSLSLLFATPYASPDIEREEKGVRKAIKDSVKRNDMVSAKVGHSLSVLFFLFVLFAFWCHEFLTEWCMMTWAKNANWHSFYRVPLFFFWNNARSCEKRGFCLRFVFEFFVWSNVKMPGNDGIENQGRHWNEACHICSTDLTSLSHKLPELELILSHKLSKPI